MSDHTVSQMDWFVPQYVSKRHRSGSTSNSKNVHYFAHGIFQEKPYRILPIYEIQRWGN